ncbi:MAG: hypothetical protein ACOYNL_04350 [Rickettsiales bacterium]
MRCTSLMGVLLSSITLTGFTSGASAFDPNAGAEPEANVARPARYTPYTDTVLPRVVTNRPLSVSPAPAITYTPQPVIAPRPAPAPIPSAAAQPYNPAPAYEAAPPPTTAASEPSAGYGVQPASQYHHSYGIKDESYDANRFSLGIEGYYDRYEEEVFDFTDIGPFGSLTGSYTHYFDPQWYAGLELRGSIGSVDYDSISGKADGITQWEVETRLLAGLDIEGDNGQRLKFYSGLGARYFSDEFKGVVTSLGASGYDRRITQIYLPIGGTYLFNAYGLQFAPNLEYDHLLFGYVNSRLQSIPGFESFSNHQKTGYGIRGELMMGQVDRNGTGWQLGPFFRYWSFDDSEIDNAGGFVGVEPENTRLQAGASVKLLF